MPTWWTGLADAPPEEAQALHALGLGFMAARTLHVALELRLFTHLAAGAQTLGQVAQALGLVERAAGRLLYACAALGLVQATGGVFRNTALTQKYLVEGQPTFIGSYLQMFDALSYHRWEQMGAALRHNGPVDDISHPYRYLADDAEDAATFSAAQHAGSRSLGHALARRVDFTPFTCLLDSGRWFWGVYGGNPASLSTPARHPLRFSPGESSGRGSHASGGAHGPRVYRRR